MNFYKLIKKSSGFTLLEVLFAVFILTIGIVGAYSAFGGMLASSSVIKERLIAAYLAQEGIEIVRNIRDTNWLQSTGTTGWQNTKDYFANCIGSSSSSPTGYDYGCEADYLTGTAGQEQNHPLVQITTTELFNRPSLYIDSDNFYSYTTTGVPSIFRRQIIVNPVTGFPNALDIIVNVYWQNRGANYNFPVESFIYNWNE